MGPPSRREHAAPRIYSGAAHKRDARRTGLALLQPGRAGALGPAPTMVPQPASGNGQPATSPPTDLLKFPMLKSFLGRHPKIAASAFIEDSAQVIGDVVVGEHSSIWFHAVVRGDVHAIRIGRETNVQDNCVLHGYKDLHPVTLGDRVTVAHAVNLHGCLVEDDCLIGIGAIVLNGARIGSGSIIAAGALVPEGTHVPPGSVFLGAPARLHRRATDADRALIARHAANYVGYKDHYLAGH